MKPAPRGEASAGKVHLPRDTPGLRRHDTNGGGFSLVRNLRFLAGGLGALEAEFVRKMDGENVAIAGDDGALAGEDVPAGVPFLVEQTDAALGDVSRGREDPRASRMAKTCMPVLSSIAGAVNEPLDFPRNFCDQNSKTRYSRSSYRPRSANLTSCCGTPLK